MWRRLTNLQIDEAVENLGYTTIEAPIKASAQQAPGQLVSSHHPRRLP